MSLGDMNQGLSNLIWTANPFWPTYGKGVWVGLFVSRFFYKILFLIKKLFKLILKR